MTDNIFFYRLAVAAIFKDESRYLKEWLDYHLLAGVEHFFLYNNDSTDNYREVLAPYGSLVTLTDCPGPAMQIPAYNDALERFRFHCRYMAFIDVDEFILPRTGQSVFEVVEDILSNAPNAAALGVNWQCFGSSGLVKADYGRGVLERFTRRAPDDWKATTDKKSDTPFAAGNHFVKLIVNPRYIDLIPFPHEAICFTGKRTVNARSETIEGFTNDATSSDKIIVNHYYTKSREEFMGKRRRGNVYNEAMEKYNEASFVVNDRNEIFDEEILRYRAARARGFTIADEAARLRRVEKTLREVFVRCTEDSFAGRLETFLTCRAASRRLNLPRLEELSLNAVYLALDGMNFYEAKLLLKELPTILSRPFPIVSDLRGAVEQVIPQIMRVFKQSNSWREWATLDYIQRLLQST